MLEKNEELAMNFTTATIPQLLGKQSINYSEVLERIPDIIKIYAEFSRALEPPSSGDKWATTIP
jgi:hypothetical protein